MPSTQYCVRPSVHWCTAHGFSILLDVDNDQYFCVPAKQFEALSSYLTDRSCPSPFDSPNPDLPTDLTALLRELEAKQLLSLAPNGLAPRHDRRPPAPARLVSTADDLVPLRHALPYALRLAKACLVADHRLRTQPFRKIVSMVAERSRWGAPHDSDQLIYLTRVFHSLRPLYPRPYLCLFDSLALLEFLAKWRLFPSWVFGVTVDPFEAHCWIQHDTVVLCDTRKFAARWFTQIMVI